MNSKLEICVDSIDSAVKAEKAGADRLELCENLLQGGVTPSLGKIHAVLNSVSIPVRVLIRPRAGNFYYSQAELNLIDKDIQLISKTHAEGLVLGALTTDNEIPEAFLKQCQTIANDKTLVLHRAFDITSDPKKSIELLIKHGFDTVLTSGQKNTAIEGLELLKTLQRDFGSQINILAGGGVRSSNLKTIAKKTGINQFHSSAKILIKESMNVSMSSSPVAEQIFTVDSNEIKSMKDQLNEI